MTLQLAYGPCHVVAPATLDGRPAYLVIIRRSECPGYPFARLADGRDAGGKFVFAIVERTDE